MTRHIEEYWVRFRAYRAPGRLTALCFDFLDSFIKAVTAVFIFLALFFRVISVSGESMLPTLNDGDVLLLSAITSSVDRGDIVVITKPWSDDEPIIKRVIGIEGDEIDIDFAKGKVYLNGEELEEDYINTPTNRMFDVQFPITVGENEVFVMGDNRNFSLDSRYGEIGLIDENYILGKQIYKIYSKS